MKKLLVVVGLHIHSVQILVGSHQLEMAVVVEVDLVVALGVVEASDAKVALAVDLVGEEEQDLDLLGRLAQPLYHRRGCWVHGRWMAEELEQDQHVAAVPQCVLLLVHHLEPRVHDEGVRSRRRI